MKRWISLAMLFSGCAFVPCLKAQDLNHGQVGIFGEYLRMSQTSTDFGGLGGRVGVNITSPFSLEAEIAYDFSKVFAETFSNGSGTVGATTSSYRVLHGLFGPKFQTKGPVRLFVTVKGGAMDFMFSNRAVSVSTFTSSVEGLRTSNVSAVFYPGGGAEAFLGPFGLRLDVGDEMYFNGGTHHNLRITFGPSIRF